MLNVISKGRSAGLTITQSVLLAYLVSRSIKNIDRQDCKHGSDLVKDIFVTFRLSFPTIRTALKIFSTRKELLEVAYSYNMSNEVQ